MDRSAVKAIVDREIEPMMERLGVPHWQIVVSYDLRDDNGICRTKGRCTRAIDYNKARIEFDPEECEDEADVLKTLRHELFHIVASPFDLYMQAADQCTKEDSPEEAILDRVFDHAVEKVMINLERMFIGLTDKSAESPPGPATAPASEPDGPPAIS
jgi:hypothetical protein